MRFGAIALLNSLSVDQTKHIRKLKRFKASVAYHSLIEVKVHFCSPSDNFISSNDAAKKVDCSRTRGLLETKLKAVRILSVLGVLVPIYH